MTKVKTMFKYSTIILISLGLGAMVTSVFQYINQTYQRPTSKLVPTTNNMVNGTGAIVDLNSLNSTTKKLTQLKFKSNRVIQLLDEVGSDSAKRVVTQLGDLNKKSSDPITLVINSPGGSVLDGALIVDAIEGSKAPVNTLCIQECASMAALIHQYGAKRMVLSRAVLMFHPAFGAAFDDVDRMVSQLQMIQRYTGKMEANVAKRSGITFEEYKRRSATQIWIDGEDAVNQHFADEMVYVSNEDVQKLFSDDTLDKSKDNSKKNVKTKSLFKNYLVYILNATSNYIRNTEFDDSSDLRHSYGDNPNSLQVPNSSGVPSFTHNVKVGM